MIYLGDFAINGKVSFLWNTLSAAGASITRATDGTLRVFKSNATDTTWDDGRSSASGITTKEDFGGYTGIHSVYIDLSDNTDAGFYAAGNEYQVAYTGVTIDGQVVNVCLAAFSIERTSGAIALTKDIQSRIPAALTGAGNIKSDILAIDGDTAVPTKLKRNLTTAFVGSVTGAVTTTTLIDSTLTSAQVDHWKDRTIIAVTGTQIGVAKGITAFDPTTDKLTFDAMPAAMSGGDIYVIV